MPDVLDLIVAIVGMLVSGYGVLETWRERSALQGLTGPALLSAEQRFRVQLLCFSILSVWSVVALATLAGVRDGSLPNVAIAIGNALIVALAILEIRTMRAIRRQMLLTKQRKGTTHE